MKKTLYGCARWFVVSIPAFFLLVFIVICFGAEWVIELPFYLVAGWFFYLKHTLREITWNWEAIASGFGFLVLSVGGFHLIALSLATSRGKVWQWKWSIRFSVLVLMIFGVSLAAGGIAHQAIWLTHAERLIGGHSMVSHHFSIANQLKQLVDLYAADHGGNFPRRLEDVVTGDYLDDFQTLERMACTLPAGEPPAAWIYVRGLSTSSPDLPLFISPRPIVGDRRIIATSGYMVELMKPATIRKHLPKWKEGYAALGIPLPPVLAEYDDEEVSPTK